jgi:hypothetical protein
MLVHCSKVATQAVRNPKAEIRGPKEIRSPKSETGQSAHPDHWPLEAHSQPLPASLADARGNRVANAAFGFRASDLIQKSAAP